MIRFIAVAGFVLAVATSAQAMTPAPIPQPEGMITQVLSAAGPVGHEFVVSVWPGPPSGTPVAQSADVCGGVEAFAVSGAGTKRPC